MYMEPDLRGVRRAELLVSDGLLVAAGMTAMILETMQSSICADRGKRRQRKGMLHTITQGIMARHVARNVHDSGLRTHGSCGIGNPLLVPSLTLWTKCPVSEQNRTCLLRTFRGDSFNDSFRNASETRPATFKVLRLAMDC